MVQILVAAKTKHFYDARLGNIVPDASAQKIDDMLTRTWCSTGLLHLRVDPASVVGLVLYKV